MLIPTVDQMAITAAKAVVDRWICQFDIPHMLLSDHGPAFESTLFKAVCKELGIEKVYSTPYHPGANGQVERQNHTINQCLTALVNDNRNNWDVFFPKVAFAFNTTSQATTQISPFKLGVPLDSMLVPHEDDQDDTDPDYTPHTTKHFVNNKQT